MEDVSIHSLSEATLVFLKERSASPGDIEFRSHTFGDVTVGRFRPPPAKPRSGEIVSKLAGDLGKMPHTFDP